MFLYAHSRHLIIIMTYCLLIFVLLFNAPVDCVSVFLMLWLKTDAQAQYRETWSSGCHFLVRLFSRDYIFTTAQAVSISVNVHTDMAHILKSVCSHLNTIHCRSSPSGSWTDLSFLHIMDYFHTRPKHAKSKHNNVMKCGIITVRHSRFSTFTTIT